MEPRQKTVGNARFQAAHSLPLAFEADPAASHAQVNSPSATFWMPVQTSSVDISVHEAKDLHFSRSLGLGLAAFHNRR